MKCTKMADDGRLNVVLHGGLLEEVDYFCI